MLKRKWKVRRFIFFVFSFLFLSLFTFQSTLAVCPICTIAISAGVGLSRWFGIDDIITGLWIGGLIVSLVIWTENYLDKRNVYFKGRILVSLAFYLGVVILPLYFSGIIGNPLNTLCFCGLDKLLFGIGLGSISFWFGNSWYLFLKEKNQGHAYFPFQKVIMPILPLVILSLIFYLLID